MHSFKMYRLDAMLNNQGVMRGGVGGKVTVHVLFVPNKFDNMTELQISEGNYRGEFTGTLLGILMSEDNRKGRMFFEDGIEVIYDADFLATLPE